MYAENFIKSFINAKGVEPKTEAFALGDATQTAYFLGTGAELVCLLAPKEEFSSELLSAFLCHLAEKGKGRKTLCGIRLDRALKERTFCFLPFLDWQNTKESKKALKAFFTAHPFRHLVLLKGEGPFVWRPPLRTEDWNAKMPMALKILADSADYPLLPFVEEENSLEHWALETFHRPVLRFAPPKISDEVEGKAQKIEIYQNLEEALLLASIL